MATPVKVHYVSAGQRPSTAAVWDDFDRPDVSSLGNAVSGQAWTVHTGTWGVTGNRAYLTANGADRSTTIDAAADFDAEVDVTTGVDGVIAALQFRRSDESNRLILEADSRPAENNFDLWRQQAAAWAKLGGWAPGGDLDNNRLYHLRIVAQGDHIKAFVDGVERVSVTSTFNQSVGRIGLFANSLPGDVTNCRWDNFSVRLLM